MRHVDLCSGIGGFSLGFEWAGLSKPILFCDVEPWCRRVLSKHWPDVPVASDVKELANDPDRNVPDCDILTAGYPCQPFSLANAGKRRGTEDDRHIWPYILSIVKAKRPTWCVFENVYGHVSMGLDEVLSDLEGQGIAARPFIVPACAADAPHRRDRVWIIAKNNDANTDSKRSYRETKHKHGKTQPTDRKERFTRPFCQVLANGENPTIRKSADVADTASQRQQGSRLHGRPQQNAQFWKPEPSICRVANGIPRRVDRLRGLGNAIVPQIAMRIGQTIKAVEMQDGR